MNDWILWKLRWPIHLAIVWYLRRVAGAFHCYEYGPLGRYVVLVSDHEYNRLEASRDQWKIDRAVSDEVEKMTAPIPLEKEKDK